MSRVRIIWNQGGVVFYGYRAIEQLASLLKGNGLSGPSGMLGQPRWKQAMMMESILRANLRLTREKLLIYREPRRINAKKSQYKTTLRTLGIGDIPRPGVTPRRTTGTHPKQKRPSRIVAILEQDLLHRADGGF